MRAFRPAAHGPSSVLVVLLWFAACVPALAQQPPADSTEPEHFFQQVPFADWEKQGPVEKFPWKVKLSVDTLSPHQRELAHITISVDGEEIARRGLSGRLIALVRVTDPAGHDFDDDGVVEISQLSPETHATIIQMPWQAFILPGQYRVELALYHTETKEHSFAVKRLSVPSRDEMRDAWRDLPSVEFFAPIEPNDLAALYRPDITSRLHLPLQTQQPVEVDVLADLTQSDVFFASRKAYNSYLSRMLPALKVFSQLDVKSGSLHVATMDLVKRRLTLEAGPNHELDWDKLKPVLNASDLGVVSVATLQSRKHPSPIFLREELQRRIAAKPHPRQVFILLTSPLDLYDFPDVKNEPMSGCDCTVYLLVFPWYYQPTTVTGRQLQLYLGANLMSGADKVKKLLAPIEVHELPARTPDDVRQALARILSETGRD